MYFHNKIGVDHLEILARLSSSLDSATIPYAWDGAG